jgi:hypothetical protein
MGVRSRRTAQRILKRRHSFPARAARMSGGRHRRPTTALARACGRNLLCRFQPFTEFTRTSSLTAACKSGHTTSRPHPDTPPVPAVLKTMGMATAVLDHVRGAASGPGCRQSAGSAAPLTNGRAGATYQRQAAGPRPADAGCTSAADPTGLTDPDGTGRSTAQGRCQGSAAGCSTAGCLLESPGAGSAQPTARPTLATTVPAHARNKHSSMVPMMSRGFVGAVAFR